MTEYNIDWENVPFVDDVNTIFTAGHLAKYGTGLKCKMFRSDEYEQVFFGFYINDVFRLSAAITYNAYDGVNKIEKIHEVEPFIMLALDGKTRRIGKKEKEQSEH